MDMDPTTFRLQSLAGVAGGQIVALEIGGGRYYALRVALSGGGSQPIPAALVFKIDVNRNGSPLPTVFVDAEPGYPLDCLVIGPAVIHVDTNALVTRVDEERNSDLLLSSIGPVMTADIYKGLRAAKWEISTGVRIVDLRVGMRVSKWSIGVRMDDEFRVVATFGDEQRDERPAHG